MSDLLADSSLLADSTRSALESSWNKASGPPDILAEELEYKEKIGGGCFGNVYNGTCRGKDVAIKKLFKQELDEKLLADFKKEVEIMARLRHPNVLLFMGACTDPGNMAIIMENIKGGNAEQVLRDNTLELSLYTRMKMARDVAFGMNWLHESKPQIIHRDLKPSNLLIDENFHVKVCDFGLSTIKVDTTSKLQDKDSVPGTPLWMAPEVLQGKPFDASSDIYSFGIVLWEIYTKEDVYPEFSSFGQFKRAICTRHHRPTVPEKTKSGSTPNSLKELIERCWHREPAQRPTFKEIIKALNLILVDVAINDKTGNEFWKKCLLGKDKVMFDVFQEKLSHFHSLPFPALTLDLTDQFKYLQYILATKKVNAPKDSVPNIVCCEDFGKLLDWFGPMGSRSMWIADLRNIMRQPWFFGDMNSKDAGKALSGRKKGTFLVRLSSSKPGQFTISKVATKGINHQRINYSSTKGFSIKVTKGTGKNKKTKTIKIMCSLEVFIRKHVSSELMLKEACKGSPYGFLHGDDVTLDKGTAVDGYVVNDSESSSED